MLSVVLLLTIFARVFSEDTPQHLHLSVTAEVTEMVITWTTMQESPNSSVLYGEREPELVVVGDETAFKDGGEEQRVIFIHKAMLTNLQPNTTYVYKVGTAVAWSKTYSFRTLPAGHDWPLSFAIFGDLGVQDGFSVPHLTKEAESGAFHLVIHNGDFAYDMDSNNGRVGDAFMQMIQETSARVPYMTAVGNHESAYNFSHYKARFNMPGEKENMFYSLNVGPVHFIAFVSDYYYYLQFGTQQVYRQYAWLEKDLETANRPENREKQPWIVAFSHRPMYCSNSNDPEHCTNPDNWVREGLPVIDDKSKYFILGLEELFYRNGVDVVFAAHEHSYERFYPVYKLKMCPKSGDDPYKDPTGPVHIVGGAGGNKEGEDPFTPNPQPWSAFHSDDYGYMRIHVHSAFQMDLEQVSVQPSKGYFENPTVIDNFTIRKSSPRTKFACHQSQKWSLVPKPLSLWDLLLFPRGYDF